MHESEPAQAGASVHGAESAGANAGALPSAGASSTATAGFSAVGGMRCWAMVLPSHREIIAAHCLPHLRVAEATDPEAARGVLIGLARAMGPFGPAMALVLARGLASPREQLRDEAIDAV